MSEDPTEAPPITITVPLLPEAPELGEARQVSPERARLLRLLYEDTEQTPECDWKLGLAVAGGWLLVAGLAGGVIFAFWYLLSHSEQKGIA